MLGSSVELSLHVDLYTINPLAYHLPFQKCNTKTKDLKVLVWESNLLIKSSF